MLIEIGQYLEPRTLSLEEQRQILRAALHPGPDARDEAIAWLPRANIESMGFDSLRLMPQLYERLRIEGIDTPLLPRLKGLKKHAWSRNNLLFRTASEAIRALQQAGIDVMLIKGTALIIAYYHDYSLRPMNDADLLVPHRQAREACQILARFGWTNEFSDPENPQLIEQALQYRHAAHLFDSRGRDLDLHWNLLTCRLGPDVDEDFWADSGESVLGGQKVRILNPADQLLHICVHGTDSSPIRWIPDALAVLRSTPDLDWDRLLAQAHKKTLTLMIGRALEHVQRDFADRVPPEV
jgi:aryl carrier-like protein